MDFVQLQEGGRICRPADFSGQKEHFDLVVVGLGTAGAVSLLQAARMGKRVLGIDSGDTMGGTLTAGLITAYYYGSPGGLYEEIDRELLSLKREGIHSNPSRLHNPEEGWQPGYYHPDAKAWLLEQKVLQAGGSFCYDTVVTGLFMEEGHRRIAGLELFSKGEQRQVCCDMVIDGTSEGKIARLAGCSFSFGREGDSRAQPFSCVLQARTGPWQFTTFIDSGYMEEDSPLRRGEALWRSYSTTPYLLDSYTDDPVYLKTGRMPGEREGRRVRTRRELTFQDFVDGKLDGPPLFYANANMDNHGKDVAMESQLHNDWMTASFLWCVAASVPVPAGAMIPEGLDNLLLCGKHMGVDHDLAPALRMARDMQKSGEAAAVLACLALDQDCAPEQVPYEKAAALLRKSGCLSDDNNLGLRDTHLSQQGVPFQWITDLESLQEGLKDSFPGIAIWSAKRLIESGREEVRQLLIGNLSSPDRGTASAFALALAGDAAGLPLLRRLAEEREPGRYPVPHCVPFGVAAVYCLGRLADLESLPLLTSILGDQEGLRHQYASHPQLQSEFIGTPEDYCFQYLSHAAAALLRVGTRHPQCREMVARVLQETVGRPGFSVRTTLKPSREEFFDMTETLRGYCNRILDRWKGEAGPAYQRKGEVE